MRQLIPAGEEAPPEGSETLDADEAFGDDGIIAQLALTLTYRPTDSLGQVGDGNRWCASPSELDDFLVFVHGHAATVWAARDSPHRITLTLQNAE